MHAIRSLLYVVICPTMHNCPNARSPLEMLLPEIPLSLSIIIDTNGAVTEFPVKLNIGIALSNIGCIFLLEKTVMCLLIKIPNRKVFSNFQEM